MSAAICCHILTLGFSASDVQLSTSISLHHVTTGGSSQYIKGQLSVRVLISRTFQTVSLLLRTSGKHVLSKGGINGYKWLCSTARNFTVLSADKCRCVRAFPFKTFLFSLKLGNVALENSALLFGYNPPHGECSVFTIGIYCVWSFIEVTCFWMLRSHPDCNDSIISISHFKVSLTKIHEME